MTVSQIAVLVSIPQVLRIFGPGFWGWIADTRGAVVGVLRLATLIPVVAGAILLCELDFTGFALVLFALHAATSGIGPLSDALLLRTVAGDAGRYGRVRLWGSIGFLLAVVVVGPLLDRTGVEGLPIWMSVLFLGVALVCWRLPAWPERLGAQPGRRIRDQLAQPRLYWFLLASALMLAAHAVLYAFFSLYLDAHGYSKGAIGALWALGVVAEIVLFFVQSRLFARFSAAGLLVFSMLCAVARFTIIAAADGAIALLLVAQLLHAITFGVHHSASMALLHRWFAPGALARAQALYTGVGYGIGGLCGALLASRVWQSGGWSAWSMSGPQLSFALAALLAGLGALGAWVVMRLEATAGRAASAETQAPL